MPTSAVLLDIDAHTVGGEVRMPLDRLAVALGRPLSTAAAGDALRDDLERYTAAHIRVVGDGGREWKVTVAGAHVERGSPSRRPGRSTDLDAAGRQGHRLCTGLRRNRR
jgi:hypothetical protein